MLHINTCYDFITIPRINQINFYYLKNLNLKIAFRRPSRFRENQVRQCPDDLSGSGKFFNDPLLISFDREDKPQVPH